MDAMNRYVQAAVIFAVLIVVGFMGLKLYANTLHISTLEAQLQAAQTTVELCAAANQDNMTTIEGLRTANTKFGELADKAMQEQRNAVERLDAALAQYGKNANEVRRLRDELYKQDPVSGAWAGLPVPRHVVDSLRAESAIDTHGDGGGGGAGTATTERQPDG